MALKIIAGIFAICSAFFIAGVSGLSFYIWPTFLNDRRLTVTPETLQRLQGLEQERKFGPDQTTFYPGAMNEEQRATAQAAVDSAIRSLIAELPRNPQRSTVLRTMKTTLANVDLADSEERDQFLLYLGRSMEICGVTTSDELFNVWRYGFPYGWVI